MKQCDDLCSLLFNELILKSIYLYECIGQRWIRCFFFENAIYGIIFLKLYENIFEKYMERSLLAMISLSCFKSSTRFFFSLLKFLYLLMKRIDKSFDF